MQTNSDVTNGKRVLVIDDSLTVTKALAKIFRSQGMMPIECTDGASAVYLAEQHKPDLILIDMVMPGVTGLEVIKEIRNRPAFNFVPLVVITANREEEQVVEALEFGADDYINKPFQEAALLARVRMHLRSSALVKELERANRELKQAREQEVESTRWKSAVEMAGAAAHKLNQPLTSIVCYADIVLKKMSQKHEDYKAVKAICEESERMAMILRKMAELTKIRTSEYVGGTTIIDLDRSFEKTNPGIFIDQIRDPNKKK